MNSMDSVGRRGKLAEEQVLLSEIPARNGVMITPTRTSNGRKGELENIHTVHSPTLEISCRPYYPIN